MLEIVARILADFDPLTIAYVALGAYFSALFHSVAGFAGGLILSILLAPVIGVKAVVPVMAMSLLISHISRAWAFRAGFRWPVYRDIMLTAFPGIIFGAAIYASLPVAAVAALLGCFLIAMIPLRRFMSSRQVVVGRRSLLGVGVPFGVLSGSTIGAGLILAPFMLGAGLAGEALLGTMAAVALTVNVTKTVVFGTANVLDLPLAVMGILIGLCTIPGNLTGRWVVRNTPIRVHILVVEGVVLVGAGYFLYAAYTGWFS